MRTLATGLVAAAVWLVGGTALASTNGVVINEFLSNPEGTDDGKEWVELYNSSAVSVDISGYIVQGATSAPFTNANNKATVPAGTTLAAGAYYVIGGADVAAANLKTLPNGSFGNNSSGNDALRLLDSAKVVIDTVVYGGAVEPANGTFFTDDSGLIAVSVAPMPISGVTLARIPNGIDTDKSGIDFKNGETTLGAANSIEIFDGGAAPDSGVEPDASVEPDSGTSGSTTSSSGESSSGESSSGGIQLG